MTVVVALAVGRASFAQAQAEVASPVGSSLSRSDWLERYQHARALLVHESWAAAARELSALEASAPSPEHRLLASELGSIARAQLLLRRDCCDQPSLRTSDELAVLYTTGVFYGLGTAGWLALQLRPATLAGALLPFAVLTPAAVGIIAFADHYRPLRHGIPHAIAAGMYLGLGEGLWLVAYQSAYAGRHANLSRWSSERVSTALWLTSTVGALAGGLIGALRRPTPGRVSLSGSAAIWGGALGALLSSAFDPDDKARGSNAYAIGAVGYNVGLVGGLLLGPSIAPSVARVRFIDLGGLLGTLLGGGLYSLIARGGDGRVGRGLAAAGGMLGLGLTFWATQGMPADRSHDQLAPAIGERRTALDGLRPWVSPARSGVLVGVSCEL